MIQADGQEIKYTLIVNELIHDYLFESYNEFMKKAKELK